MQKEVTSAQWERRRRQRLGRPRGVSLLRMRAELLSVLAPQPCGSPRVPGARGPPLSGHPQGLTRISLLGALLAGCGHPRGLAHMAGCVVGSGGLSTVESGDDYVNVPESGGSADASLGKWLAPPYCPPPTLPWGHPQPSPLCPRVGRGSIPLGPLPQYDPPSLVPTDGSREYVNVLQELPVESRSQPGECQGWGL